MKKCSKCNEEKELHDFSRDKNRANGLSPWCKKCANAAVREWASKNPSKARKWAKENPEKSRKIESEWRKRHPEKSREYSRNHYAKKTGAGITSEEEKELFNFYDNTCLCCGKKEPDITLTLDHVIPLDWGGINEISNAQPLCISCNCSKSNRHATDYRPHPIEEMRRVYGGET